MTWIVAGLALAILTTIGFANPHADATVDTNVLDTLASSGQVRILDESYGPLAMAPASAVALVFPSHRAAAREEITAALGFAEHGGLLVLAVDGPTEGWDLAGGHLVHARPVRPMEAASCILAHVPVPSGAIVDACFPSPAALPDVNRSDHQLGRSINPAFLDLDGDGNLSLGDPEPRHYPISRLTRHGEGWLLVLADDDLWADDDPGNQALLAALALGRSPAYLDATGDDGTVASQAQRNLHRSLDAPDGRARGAIAAIAAAALLVVFALRPLPPWQPRQQRPGQEDPELEHRFRTLR